MARREIVWVRHTWSLDGAEIRLVAPAGYDFDSASPDEGRRIIHVVLSAYASDPYFDGGV